MAVAARQQPAQKTRSQHIVAAFVALMAQWAPLLDGDADLAEFEVVWKLNQRTGEVRATWPALKGHIELERDK